MAKILKPCGKPLPIIFGWGSRGFDPDQDTVILIAKSLVNYCCMQWEHFASRQARQEGDRRRQRIATQDHQRPDRRGEHEIATAPSWAERQVSMLAESGDQAEVVRRLTDESRISE